MNKHTSAKAQTLFRTERDDQNILFISTIEKQLPKKINIVDYLTQFVDVLNTAINQDAVIGIIYTCPIPAGEIGYKQLLEQISVDPVMKKKIETVVLTASHWNDSKKPIVSILDHNCIGIALATMLWADCRIAIPNLTLGFPESKFGLFTGFGTTIHLPPLIGDANTLDLMTQGKLVGSQEAYDMGLLNKLTTLAEDCLSVAKAWIIQHPEVPSFSPLTTHELTDDDVFSIQKRARGLYPGTNAVIALLKDRLSLTLEESVEQETTLYCDLMDAPGPLNMIRTLHYGVREAQSNQRIKRLENYTLNKIGILGAGMMGSGIAYEAARAGIKVVLKDVNLAQAKQGKAYAIQLCEKLLKLGYMDTAQQEQLLSHILPSEKVKDLEESDCIIEAVFEDFQLKADVTKQSIPYLSEKGFFASNTTSLPITALAKATNDPKDFIGMHFFSPVDRMPIVEIICGEKTDQITLEKALTLALRLNKIPIVVRDGPGFFTSRIFFNYLLEGITMVLEGIPASSIEEEAIAAGFAVGPLAVLDEISLELMLHVYDQLPNLHASQKRAYNYLKTLISLGRKGKKAGAGFYDYDTSNKKKTIWRNPTIKVLKDTQSPTFIRKRLLHVMALDSYRCLAEGVLNQPIDGDIGSILGVGFASHTGGVFGHIDLTTLPLFVQDCQTFQSFGEQWELPESLIQLAEENFHFYDGFISKWK